MTTEASSFQAHLTAETVIAPPPEFVAQTNAPDYDALYNRAAQNPEAYWEEQARQFEWFRPWTRVREINYPFAKWFVGAQCNITVNCLDRHANGERKNKVALLFLTEDGQERIYTYAMLHRRVQQAANALKSLGVGKGDRVCIYMPLTPEGIIAMLACARIGAVHSVVYAGLGHTALRSRIQDAQAKVILTADIGVRRGRAVQLKEIVDEAVKGLDFVQKIAVYRRGEPKIALDPARELDWNALCDAQPGSCPPEVMDANDPLFILYTSGTTGQPKGVVYTHGAFVVGVTPTWKLACDIKEDDIYWCTSDIGWIVGHSIMVYGPFANGTTCVVREGAPDWPDPGVVWSIVEKYGVTKIYTAPTAVRMFMKFGEEYPDKYDLSSLRLVNCAGEPLNPEAWQWFYRVIGKGRVPLVDDWWQTETAAPTIGTWPCMASKPGRAGKPFPGIEADVLDRQGKPVGVNEGGFLVLKGFWPYLMSTIYGDEDRYRQYFDTIEGVYTAGDVATKDADGYYMVLGRADDVVNVAGHRIGTADVESALVSHPAVAEAAAIGKPDPVRGESIKVFVTLRLGQQPSDELKAALIRHVREEAGPIAAPSELDFVTSLPKTRSGKIMRRLLKARELGLDPGDITTLEE
ncbi:MAG TPA: acetate--CoA ligase [Dehalococcoidia bacterium]|nr:acetate--CoA ligase [Dehalococcoidia bacterium]